MEDLMVFERKEVPVVSSRVIAEKFEKNHRDVVRAIRDIIEGMRKSAHTPSKYFIRSEYIHEQNGQHYSEYLCTRDGFSLLTMGLNGQKALEWKLKYIDIFDKMEHSIEERRSSEWLLTRKQGKLIRRSETDSITKLIDYAKTQGSQNADKMYITYSQLVNSLVGIKSDMRGKVPFKTISTIGFLEDMILHTVDEEMVKGTHYKEIYRICKQNGEQIMKFAYLPQLAA